MVEVYHLADDVVGAGLLGKQETATRHAMAQRDGGHRQRAVFVDYCRSVGVELMEEHFVRHLPVEEAEHWRQQRFQSFGRMDVQLGGASQQIERRDESQQAEAMVAMQVGDENMIQPRELQTRFAELQLRAFTAIYHKQFIT